MKLKVQTRRMTTSRTDETKHEHFTMLVREDGKTHDLWMRYDPQEAHFQSLELAKFLDVPCDPLVIDGKPVEMDGVFKTMLED